MEPVIRRGIPEIARRQAAALYDEAFGRKIRPGIPDRAQRIAVLADGLVMDRAIAALRGDELLGLAGFHDGGRSFTGGVGWEILRRRLGVMGAVRAGLILGLLDRRPRPGELLMDGIVVRADSRGKGIGSQLFAALEEVARELGSTSIRLDVIDTNPAARRLYERLGFVAVKEERFPYLRFVFGFGGSTSMQKALDV